MNASVHVCAVMAYEFDSGSESDEMTLDSSNSIFVARCGACHRIKMGSRFSAKLRCICEKRICDACASDECGLCGHAVRVEDNELTCDVCPDTTGCVCISTTTCTECEPKNKKRRRLESKQ